MKRFRNVLAIIIAVGIVFGLTACSGKSDQQPETSKTETEDQKSDMQMTEENGSARTEQQTTDNDILVVYFSATGTTKGVAEKIEGITGADIYEIIPADPYSQEDLDYNDSQSRATVEMNDPDARPEIGSDEISLAGYTTLYIGYPIWWGDAPRIMSTFVENHDFDGITVIPFCTSGSSGIGNSDTQLAGQSASGSWISGSRFSGDVSESDLQVWIDGLQ